MAAATFVFASGAAVLSSFSGEQKHSRCSSAAAAELAVPRQHSGAEWSSLSTIHGTRRNGMLGCQLQVVNVQPSSRFSKQHGRSYITRCMEAEELTVDNSSVLVIGGGGVGLETMKALSVAGSWVTGYQRSDKFRKDIESLGAMLAIGDVLDPATIEKTLKSNSFDAIVCTVGGGTTDPEVDKQGPINLIDAAKKTGVKRFILALSESEMERTLKEAVGKVSREKTELEAAQKSSVSFMRVCPDVPGFTSYLMGTATLGARLKFKFRAGSIPFESQEE